MTYFKGLKCNEAVQAFTITSTGDIIRLNDFTAGQRLFSPEPEERGERMETLTKPLKEQKNRRELNDPIRDCLEEQGQDKIYKNLIWKIYGMYLFLISQKINNDALQINSTVHLKAKID